VLATLFALTGVGVNCDILVVEDDGNLDDFNFEERVNKVELVVGLLLVIMLVIIELAVGIVLMGSMVGAVGIVLMGSMV
jgi:hypothetical protein